MLYDIGASKGIKFESRLGNVKDRKSDVREKYRLMWCWVIKNICIKARALLS